MAFTGAATPLGPDDITAAYRRRTEAGV